MLLGFTLGLVVPPSAPLPIEPFISAGGTIIATLLTGFFGVYGVREHRKSKAAKERAQRDAERDQKIDTLLSRTAATLDQVANTHDSNLRDDLDEKFAGLERQIRSGDARTHARIDKVVERLDRHIDGK